MNNASSIVEPPVVDTMPVNINGSIVYVSRQEAELAAAVVDHCMNWICDHPDQILRVLALGSVGGLILFFAFDPFKPRKNRARTRQDAFPSTR